MNANSSQIGEALSDRARLTNGRIAMVLKVPNAMTTMSRISDFAIVEGGAV
jgi:hypothetical protein